MKRATRLCGAVASLLGAIAALAQPVQSPQRSKVVFNLAAQPLEAALNALAVQSKLHIVFNTADAQGKRAQGISGAYTPGEALAMILEKTDLSFEFVDEQTVEIRSRSTARVGRGVASFRLADSTQSVFNSSADAENPAGGAVADVPSATNQGIDCTRSENRDSEACILTEVVVTGSQIRGVRNSTAPVTVISKEDIDATGYSSVVALVESLPQNFALANQSSTPNAGTSFSTTQGSSLNLRAIGEGTTLVLINGRRIAPGFASSAVDVAGLPLSAVERVEVLTDGASAIYGSDAVGGVVNFILRKNFEGAETRLLGGQGRGDRNEFRASQALGTAWSSGNAVVSLEYSKRDLLRSKDRDFVPAASLIGSLLPEDKSYSAFLSVNQEWTPSVSVFFDGLYSRRDSYNEGGRITLSHEVDSELPQMSLTSGLRWQVGGDWQMEASGGYASNELDQDQNGSSFAPGNQYLINTRYLIRTAGLKGDGALMSLPGGNVRLAVGGEWRSDDYRYFAGHSVYPLAPTAGNSDQTVRSVFAEFFVPIVGEANEVSGVRRLELSLAGRYDDYSNFGSSLDPRVGLMWEPAAWLRLRGSYGTSYLAPKLHDYFRAGNAALAWTFFDPGLGVPTKQLLLGGTDVSNLGPQQSKSYSFGVDFAPLDSRVEIGLNYFNISYEDRISMPGSFLTMLANSAGFGALITRNPSVDQVNAAIADASDGGVPLLAFDPFFMPDPNFDPATVQVIVDTRRRNLSVVETNGLDLAASYRFPVGSSELSVGINGTYILKLDQQVTPTTSTLETVDTIFNPPDWRARAYLGWKRSGWSGNLFVNHVDSYTDNRAPALVPISSNTTIDMRLAYTFGESSGAMSGVTLAFNAQNLFDRDPPSVPVITAEADMGFDPSNASPAGRIIALELMKAW